jgi:hypothetical protein
MSDLRFMQTAASPQSSFAFVMNIEALKEPNGFLLWAGLRLRRATPGEVVEIRQLLIIRLLQHAPTGWD